ncbi:MAG: transcription initiation protein [Actinobacteria bacterium]|nr:transcription initiation protein [Actinomycetota bacterium]
MKYMLMMFGNAGEMMEVQSPEWIRDMIGFMTRLDVELTENGEMVFNAGLADSTAAKLVHADGLVTDGPYAEAKESLIGFWILDVASEERITEIATSIAKYSRIVEVRPVAEAPPEV